MQTRRLLLLGAPRLEQDGTLLKLERRKAMALLAYLAVSGQPHTREALATLFWQDDERARAYAYLRNTLWTINKALGDDWAVIEGETVAFNRTSGIEVDVEEFVTCISAAATLTDHRARIETLNCASEVYRADFMAGFTLPDADEFANWQTITAEELRQQFGNALSMLTEDYNALGEWENALACARRHVSLDPLCEAAHRDLMRLYAESDQQAAALRQYRDLTQLLTNELGTQPEATTTALYEAIQQRRSEPVQPKMEMPYQKPESYLPTPTTPLIGRTEELAELARLLDDPACRLLSLIGPGGMGKTRLAIQAGSDNRFPDGAYFISLAPLCTMDAIIPTIAAALPFVQQTRDDPHKRLVEALRDKRALLILDNFEHLLDGAELLPSLLEKTPDVKMLVTSRERLNLREEYLYEMRGLAYPSANGNHVENYDSVQLFISGAARVKPDFKLTPENAPDVALICRMVEGMPLGIELAASWVQMLSCREIAEEIQRNIDFLTTPARNVPERHRSLRAVFESSWSRLTFQEQSSLSELSVFRGGFRLEAASVVAGASLHLLLTLVSKSLLYRNQNGRFEIHELLRQYAEEKMSEQDRLATLERHGAYIVNFLNRQLPALKSGEQARALMMMAEEIDNIRIAVQYMIRRRDTAGLQATLEPLFHFHAVRTYFVEFVDLFEQAATMIEEADTAEKQILSGSLHAYTAMGRQPVMHQAELDRLTQKAYEILREHPDRIETALPLIIIGSMKRRPGRVHSDAEPIIRDALALFKKHGDLWGEAYALYSIATTLHMQIRYAEARELFHQSLELFQKIGQPWGQLIVMDMLSENMFTLGNYEVARGYLSKMLPILEALGEYQRIGTIGAMLSWYEMNPNQAISSEVLTRALHEYHTSGDRRGEAWTRYNLGWIAQYTENNLDKAHKLYQESLREFLELGEDEGIIWSYIFLASVAVTRREFDQVSVYAEHARAAMEGMNFPWGESGLDYVLGDAALAQNDIDSAEQLYKNAVRVAHECQSVMQTLRHLAGIAEVWWRREMPEAALSLAIYLRDNPTTWDDTRRRVRAFIDTMTEVVPPEMITASEIEAGSYTLDSAVVKALEAQ